MKHNAAPKIFVILLHGYLGSPSNFNSLLKEINECFSNPKIVNPKMPLGLLSCANPVTIINDLLSEVQNEWDTLTAEEKKEHKIIIIGYSTGAILARKLYITACGQNADAPFEEGIKADSPTEWTANVERIILFAGMNKGWSLNQHMPLLYLAAYNLSIGFGNLMMLLRLHPVIYRSKNGNPFITQLRIQALSMYRHAAKKGFGNALTVQLLGTQDILVSPDDNVDLMTDNNFIYMEVPESDHKNVIDMSGKKGENRAKVVRKALILSHDELKENWIVPTDQFRIPPDPEVTDVVFVIHGIRDTGYWTQKIARRVKSAGDKLDGRKFAIETSTYGYFPMLSFLLFPFRQKKVAWFVDQYIENMALYPNAVFSFVGHSNGTYLLARAMRKYPALRFRNVVLAGSVVPHSYNWHELIEQERIANVYNFVATNDWVVGIFPKTFETLRLQDLGGGGFVGFENFTDQTEFRCIAGGHSAAIEENTWDELTELAINGKPSGKSTIAKFERSATMRFIGFIGPIIFFLAIFLILLGGFLIIYFVTDPVKRLLWSALYWVVWWRVLTKF